MPRGKSRTISKEVYHGKRSHSGFFGRKAGSGFGGERDGRGLGYQPPTGLGKTALVKKKASMIARGR